MQAYTYECKYAPMQFGPDMDLENKTWGSGLRFASLLRAKLECGLHLLWHIRRTFRKRRVVVTQFIRATYTWVTNGTGELTRRDAKSRVLVGGMHKQISALPRRSAMIWVGGGEVM